MPTINDFGIPGVSQGLIYAPKLQHKYRVTFLNIAGLPSSTALSAQATKVGRPKLSFEEVEQFRYVARTWTAGRYNYEPINMTIEDDITSAASQIIQAQVSLQQQLTGAGAGPFLPAALDGHTYKFAARVDTLDGQDGILETFVLEGCWIKNVEYPEGNYNTSADKSEIQLTLRFDNFYQTFTGTSGKNSLGGPGSTT